MSPTLSRIAWLSSGVLGRQSGASRSLHQAFASSHIFAARDRLARRERPHLVESQYVLLRPEEIHRASGEDDVVPPVRGRDVHVHDVVVRRRSSAADVDLDRLARSPARARDVPVDVERREDAERVPRAVRVPPAIAGAARGAAWGPPRTGSPSGSPSRLPRARARGRRGACASPPRRPCRRARRSAELDPARRSAGRPRCEAPHRARPRSRSSHGGKETVMKITTIGRGNIGGGLANRWRKAGHDVTELGQRRRRRVGRRRRARRGAVRRDRRRALEGHGARGEGRRRRDERVRRTRRGLRVASRSR